MDEDGCLLVDVVNMPYIRIIMSKCVNELTTARQADRPSTQSAHAVTTQPQPHKQKIPYVSPQGDHVMCVCVHTYV